jgi:hypothetical protein
MQFYPRGFAIADRLLGHFSLRGDAVAVYLQAVKSLMFVDFE